MGAFESLRGFRVGWPNKYPKFSKGGGERGKNLKNKSTWFMDAPYVITTRCKASHAYLVTKKLCCFGPKIKGLTI